MLFISKTPQMKYLFILMLCLFCQPISAVEIGQLDEATIAVQSRSSAEKSDALKQALASVFVKNSGSPSVVMHPTVKEKIDSPEVLLIQYGYVMVDDQLSLKASFDHQRVINTLRQADLPVWGAQRPLTLVWLTYNKEADIQILSDSSNDELRANLMQDANNKGIPLMLPVMDLDDVMAISVTDIKGMFIDVISNASNRYDSDYFAVADIGLTGNSASYQLALYDKKITSGIREPLVLHRGDAIDAQEAAKQMVSLLADYHISQYAIASTGDSAEVNVSFVGINTMQKLVDLEKYLKQLSAVKGVVLSQYQQDTATYHLSLFSGIEDLQRLLDIDNRLSRIDSMGTVDSYFDNQEDKALKIIYQWKH